jgi:hypothetical protein
MPLGFWDILVTTWRDPLSHDPSHDRGRVRPRAIFNLATPCPSSPMNVVLRRLSSSSSGLLVLRPHPPASHGCAPPSAVGPPAPRRSYTRSRQWSSSPPPPPNPNLDNGTPLPPPRDNPSTYAAVMPPLDGLRAADLASLDELKLVDSVSCCRGGRELTGLGRRAGSRGRPGRLWDELHARISFLSPAQLVEDMVGRLT